MKQFFFLALKAAVEMYMCICLCVIKSKFWLQKETWKMHTYNMNLLKDSQKAKKLDKRGN